MLNFSIRKELALKTVAALFWEAAFLGGCGLVAYGVWLWNKPFGFIVAGLIIAVVSLLVRGFGK